MDFCTESVRCLQVRMGQNVQSEMWTCLALGKCVLGSADSCIYFFPNSSFAAASDHPFTENIFSSLLRAPSKASSWPDWEPKNFMCPRVRQMLFGRAVLLFGRAVLDIRSDHMYAVAEGSNARSSVRIAETCSTCRSPSLTWSEGCVVLQHTCNFYTNSVFLPRRSVVGLFWENSD